MVQNRKKNTAKIAIESFILAQTWELMSEYSRVHEQSEQCRVSA